MSESARAKSASPQEIANQKRRRLLEEIVLDLRNDVRKTLKHPPRSKAAILRMANIRPEEIENLIERLKAQGYFKIETEDMANKTKKNETVEETIYARIFPHGTGKGGYSMEVRIPNEVRDKLRIDKNTPLYVKVGENKIIFELAPKQALRETKRR